MEAENKSNAKDNVVGSVMVVGGGIAGIQASLDLADSGYLVKMVEGKSAIGGVMAQLDKTFPTNDCSMCIISPKLVEAGRHLNVDLFTTTEVEKVEGEAGNFKVTLLQHPRYIELDKCTACGECAKVCPVDVDNQFDESLRARKAAYKLYPQGMPSAYAIDKRGSAPCKVACPLNPSIQGCFALIRAGKYKEAFELFRQEHPFPGICGRVCNHPCETACTRNQVDQPLDIRNMHRFLADWAETEGITYKPEQTESHNEKVAVVGSGPGGLACAYFLALEGYQVTVFEKHPVLGGMLSIGIPAYRLPRDIIDKEIQVIRDLGVEFKTNVDIGKDITIGKLRDQGYKAFFLAVGAQECKALGIDGEDFEGVYPGVDFLRRVNLGEKIALGDRVAVIGGGNVAMDSVRTALRTGSKKPFIIYRRSESEMPAAPEEIAECRDEGIEIMTLTNPIRVIAENGRIRGIECINMQLGEPDASGRRRPEPVAGSEFTIEVDALVPAIGQESDWACLTDECACTLSDWGTMKVDSVTLQTNDQDIFAGGDAVSGPSTVVEAFEAGKRAAVSIARFIQGEDLHADREDKMHAVTDVPVAGRPLLPRQKMPHLGADQRVDNFTEVQLGYSEAQILEEAKRCLDCGICSECYQCVDACLAKAVNHDMQPQRIEVEVGSIILAPGFTPYDPSKHEFYAYAKHPNVVTALEFERILSASGPYQGHLVRPSDHKEPEKIAWLQCIGSRDINKCDHSYCSAVCCMYAAKQTVIAKEHSDKGLDTAVFYMDMRTYGKDFERYYNRAKEEHGVRFERSRIHTIDPMPNDQLRLRYVTPDGDITNEIFDMVVLSVGIAPNDEAVKLAAKMGIELNSHQFAQTQGLAPVATTREGIFVCGTFQGPKDIPQSVMEASASAAAATQMLAQARGSQTRIKELPPELDTTGQEPRIGVFVCNCGINIGGVADVPAVRDYARDLPHVVHVEDALFTCSQDNQDHMKEIIQEKRINRVVVASCSPRTHEPLFQETIREAGLNKYMFEMANIRDQNTWVHMNNPEKATAKAKDLVRMAVAKAAYIEPLHQVSMPVKRSALVVGGGAAGLSAAQGIAQQGFDVHLVEKSAQLGGNALWLRETWQGEAIKPFIEGLIEKVQSNPRIKVHLNSQTVDTTGILGNFTTTISGNGDGGTTVIEHGATVLATGGTEYKPTEYLYGEHPDVLTHKELDEAMTAGDPRIAQADTAAFIQCVGSRNEQRPSCSRICCTHSVKSAIGLKKQKPEMNVFVLYRDVRTYGFREDLYRKARELGVIFIRFGTEAPPQVVKSDDGRISLTVKDHILGRPVELNPDLLVLAAAVLPNENKKLFELFKVPINAEGFLVEAHAKLRPVDFSSEGLFMAGLAHYPKSIDETIAQAQAAVSRACTILSKEAIWVGGVVAEVNPERCAVCLTCVRTCPYHTPYIHKDGYAFIEAAGCHGCGCCVSECPGKAITLKHFTDDQLIAKTSALFQECLAAGAEQ